MTLGMMVKADSRLSYRTGSQSGSRSGTRTGSQFGSRSGIRIGSQFGARSGTRSGTQTRSRSDTRSQFWYPDPFPIRFPDRFLGGRFLVRLGVIGF